MSENSLRAEIASLRASTASDEQKILDLTDSLLLLQAEIRTLTQERDELRKHV